MDEKVGSYVIDKDGNHQPNADDEAMAERHEIKKDKKGLGTDFKSVPNPRGLKKEVTKDAGK